MKKLRSLPRLERQLTLLRWLLRRGGRWTESSVFRGIVTDVIFYEDGSGQLIPYPLVFWEGQLTASATHPANLVPARKVRLRYIETDGA